MEMEPGLGVLAVLGDPMRRSAYRVVAAAASPVGRDDVARELGVGRTLAAHHLDKLVDAGLLEVAYVRRSGRSGPGAGRPAKVYSRAPGEHAVSVPPRAYRSAAELLAEAVDRSGADAVLYAVARERGRSLGAAAPADLVDALTAQGYEPRVEGDAVVRLGNCPFHLLAEEFPPLVCGMNLALLEGFLDGAGTVGCTARMDPGPGRCCVSIEVTKNNGD